MLLPLRTPIGASAISILGRAVSRALDEIAWLLLGICALGEVACFIARYYVA